MSGKKAFSIGFAFGVFITFGWVVYQVAALDEGTSQDPRHIRHLDGAEEF